jgi:tetratricopeptide (TPR) repeat protein
LLAGGQEALNSGEAAAAASRFGEELGLWRGPAFSDVADVERLAREAARLEELRLAAVEGRIEADLAVGRYGEVMGELESLVAEFPLRERLWRLLMLAFYRCGRQAEALAVYRRARDMLADELGLEPSKELRALEQAVLRQEVPAPPPLARHSLPAPLTGRARGAARTKCRTAHGPRYQPSGHATHGVCGGAGISDVETGATLRVLMPDRPPAAAGPPFHAG